VINMPRKKKAQVGTDKARFQEEQALKKQVSDNVGKIEKYIKALGKISTEPILNIFERAKETEKAIPRILTGTMLDRILSRKGGIEIGSTVEFYGIFASGKTQILKAVAAEALKRGKVIYIDSEATFRPDQFEEICEIRNVPVEKLDNFLYYQPEDWITQEAVTMQLPEFDDDDMFLDVVLIIVDSFMKHWASTPEFYGRDKLTYRQQLVRAQAERLTRYARRHGAILMYTNQVYDKPVDTTFAPPEEKIGARGGRTLEHIADYRLFLRKGRGSMRFARLVDSPDIPLMEVPFVLSNAGVSDITDDIERAKAAVVGLRYTTKFGDQKVSSVDAGKEFKIKALEFGYINEEEAISQGLTEKEVAKALDARNKKMEDVLGDDLTDEEREIMTSMAAPELEEEVSETPKDTPESIKPFTDTLEE
jgi:RecA/RadA recombinase